MDLAMVGLVFLAVLAAPETVVRQTLPSTGR